MCVLYTRNLSGQTQSVAIAYVRTKTVIIEILSEGEGLRDIEIFHAEHGATAFELIRRVADRGGFPAEEAVLFIEGADEPIEIAGLVIDEQFRDRAHHVHRARSLDIHVAYQDKDIEHHYSPAVTVQRALDWAIGPHGFKIDPAIAPEMELALEGSEKPLPRQAHLGRFVHHPSHELRLDLIRGVIPNGGINR